MDFMSKFDSTMEPLQVEDAHLGPRCNEVVADAIAAHIRDPGDQVNVFEASHLDSGFRVQGAAWSRTARTGLT